MEAERRRRENELVTVATIKTAEGAKQSEVLRSEGALIAQKNQAEAHYVNVTRQADGERYRIEAEARAKAQEIEAIAQTLNGDSEQAARFILEMKRLEQLKAIANGNNNSVYVLPAQLTEVLGPLAQKLQTA